jgi:PAS domain S-box-containing protein
MRTAVTPTKVERFFDPSELIASKTGLKGRITYANRVFCKVAGFSEAELIGQPHSIIRHPDMPRAVFKLLWDTLFAGQEIFAYVKNMARNGDSYWVFAHVTPSYDAAGQMVAFHSNRRAPSRSAIEPIYAEVLAEEARHKNGKDQLDAGFKRLTAFVESTKKPYDELVLSLSKALLAAGAVACALVVALASAAAGWRAGEIAALITAALAIVVGLRWLLRLRGEVGRITEVCREVAVGNLEARLVGVTERGELAEMQHALNDMIDRCDAFVRESAAAMQAVRAYTYYRRIRPEGLSGALHGRYHNQ